MNQYEIKIKKFLEKNNFGFKKVSYVKRYCPKYIDRSLNIKSNLETKGRIKIKDTFRADYRVEIHRDRYDGLYFLFIGNLSNQGVFSDSLDKVISFNENLARHLGIWDIRADAMSGVYIEKECKAYDQMGYEVINGYFGLRGKIL